MTWLYNKYVVFILNPAPSKVWQTIRFILHWATLPIKLIVMGLIGIYGILYNKFTYTNTVFPDVPLDVKKEYTKKIINFLPVMGNEFINLYLPRQPYYMPVDGTHHVTDHQCLRQGEYVAMMRRFGKATPEMETALQWHISGNWLLRGYNWDFADKQLQYNASSTSGDMLLGLSLAMLDSDSSILEEKFDQLIANIIEYDYALLEGAMPDQDPAKSLWNSLYEKESQRVEKIRMKSYKGMWQPGLETVGAQALTILAALRVADKKLKNKEAGRYYKKLLNKYGYGLLSLIPTCYVPSSRGYFNDVNCMHALYILSELSDSKLGKLFWKLPMVYVWHLSKNWSNPYITGLLEKAHPGTVDPRYIKNCQNYLFSHSPATSVPNSTFKTTTKNTPMDYNLINYDEFNFECALDAGNLIAGTPLYRTGLGFLSAVSVIETDPRALIE